jgi:hypothetical protein
LDLCHSATCACMTSCHLQHWQWGFKFGFYTNFYVLNSNKNTRKIYW